LSTAEKRSVPGRPESSHVASYDDIHTAVENMGKHSKNHDDDARKVPGQFVSDELEEQTARFLEEVKELAERRKARESEEGSGPPPRGAQRSSRR